MYHPYIKNNGNYIRVPTSRNFVIEHELIGGVENNVQYFCPVLPQLVQQITQTQISTFLALQNVGPLRGPEHMFPPLVPHFPPITSWMASPMPFFPGYHPMMFPNFFNPALSIMGHFWLMSMMRSPMNQQNEIIQTDTNPTPTPNPNP